MRPTIPGGNAFHRIELDRFDGRSAVHGLTQGIDHAADKLVAYGHGRNAARALDRVAFANLLVFAEQHHADIVFIQIEGHAHDVVGKFEQFARHGVFQAVYPGDTVTGLDHRADFSDVDLPFIIADLLLMMSVISLARALISIGQRFLRKEFLF